MTRFRPWQMLIVVIIFAIAMAFLETAVVVYLRKLYYPEGFDFPLRMIGPDIALTEFLREIATLVMLAGIGFIAGRNSIERFAYFILSFAVWDIFYYVFLYLLLGWPVSLLTWDILFLVPVTWVGPVLAPCINSLMMIGLALTVIYLVEKRGVRRLGPGVWAMLIIGSLIVIVSYTEEYSIFMTERFSPGQLLGGTADSEIIAYACSFIPKKFAWWLFASGAGLHLAANVLLLYQNRKKTKPTP